MTLKLENKIKLKYDRKIKISEYQSIYTTNSHNKELMYSDFVNNLMIPKVTNEKGSAGCFIAGFVDGIRNKKNTKTRSMLTLDIDNELTFDGQRAAIWLRNNIANYFKFSYVMYSTHNSTKENPRYRLIIPLKKDVNPNESIMICKYITNYILRINVDSSSFNFSQVMFYPTCKNIENYEFYFNDEEFLDPNLILEKVITLKSKKGGYKKDDPRKKLNWVGAWCNVYSITGAINKFLSDIYKYEGNFRYTYIKGTSRAGFVVYDNDTHGYSFHSTDPISGKCVNAFDLVRLHLYEDLDDGSVDIKNNPSYKAMIDLCKSDERVREYYKKNIAPYINQEFDLKVQQTIPNFFDGKGKLMHHELARYLVKKENIIKLESRLHVYQEGKYTPDIENIKKKIIKIIPDLTERQINEVVSRMRLITDEKSYADSRYINLKNGIYDLEEDKFIKHSPDIIITNQINAIYNPNVKCDEVDKMFNIICKGNKELIDLILEIIGYTLYRKNIFAKSFLFYGNGGNGKSTLFKMIANLLGKENITSLSLSDLNQRFKPALLAGKLANIGDDIPATSIRDTSMFKKLSSGDYVVGEYKGETPFQFQNYAKLIFACNRIPIFFDNSKGFKDRLVIVPLTNEIRGSKHDDPNYIDKITTDDAKSYLLYLSLKALKRLLNRGEFTMPRIVAAMFEDFEDYNNPIQEFVKNYPIKDRIVSDVYKDYQEYCGKNGYKPWGKNLFGSELKYFGFISKRKYNSSLKKYEYIYYEANE